MIKKEQIAHDLAMAYINNRYGAEVSGEFDTSEGSDGGSVYTERLPHVDKIRKRSVGTGEKYFFGLLERSTLVDDGYEVDPVFELMIDDYFAAFRRFMELLSKK